MVYVGQNAPAKFRLHVVYHVIGWGMPAVIVIVALAKQRIGNCYVIHTPFVPQLIYADRDTLTLTTSL